MAEKKKQHTIPNCYLKSWCDPNTPVGQQPYIWRISKDGQQKRKKSPEKSFTETDRYTIKLPNGERDLVVENTLAQLENEFVRVLQRLRRRERLNAFDKARLCTFTAAMHTRSKAMGDHWKKQMTDLHEKVVAMEKQHNAQPSTSLETAQMVEHAPPYIISAGVSIQTPLLFQMAMTIMVATDDVGFITSDTPCAWFNPKWYKLPPFYRSPGLAQPEIEVSLPLTPNHLLVISHNHELPVYTDVGVKAVDEMNRRTRFHCAEEFVSWKGETRDYWFDSGKEPEDSWENSEEGKTAMAHRDEMMTLRKKWEEQQKREGKL